MGRVVGGRGWRVVLDRSVVPPGGVGLGWFFLDRFGRARVLRVEPTTERLAAPSTGTGTGTPT
jgi:hypothetical protein